MIIIALSSTSAVVRANFHLSQPSLKKTNAFNYD